MAMTVAALPALAADPIALKPGELLRGRFIQERFLTGFDKPVRSEGSFVLAPGHGLIWRGETPFPVITAIAPAGIVQSVGGTETMRLSAAKLPFLARLHAIMGGAMAGDWQSLESEFAVSREAKGATTMVTLTPLRADAGQPVKSITARVGRFVEEVDVVKPNGDHDRLRFSDQAIATAPPTAEEAAILATAAR